MNRHKLTLITGASSNHFKCLRNLLYSASVFEPGTAIIVYDLGLKPEEAEALKRDGYDLRAFQYRKYPSHLNIHVNCGQYAWKPVLIADTLNHMIGMLLWLDAGNLIHARLDMVRDVLNKYGVYSPVSGDTVIRWTHPDTLKYLNVSTDMYGKRNRHGAFVGFNSEYTGIRQLVEKWKECALDINCIAPEGSCRKNHRQDQAVLTILMYQFQKKYGYTFVDDRLRISAHNDRLSEDEVRQMLSKK